MEMMVNNMISGPVKLYGNELPDFMADEFFAPLSGGQPRPALSLIAQE
jgi:hypothetical protein